MVLQTHPDWRSLNKSTKYPFTDQATLTNSGGQFFSENVFGQQKENVLSVKTSFRGPVDVDNLHMSVGDEQLEAKLPQQPRKA